MVWFIQYVVWEGGVRVWGLIRILRVHSSVRETVQDESILRKRFDLSPPLGRIEAELFRSTGINSCIARTLL